MFNFIAYLSKVAKNCLSLGPDTDVLTVAGSLEFELFFVTSGANIFCICSVLLHST